MAVAKIKESLPLSLQHCNLTEALIQVMMDPLFHDVCPQSMSQLKSMLIRSIALRDTALIDLVSIRNQVNRGCVLTQ